MKNSEQINGLIAKYLSGECSPEDEACLFAWVEEDAANRMFFEEMARIWELSEQEALIPFEVNLQDSWANIENAIATDVKLKAKMVLLRRGDWRWSVAAAILILLSFVVWFFVKPELQDSLVSVFTGNNERKEIILPDSSRVWLNENSRLVYPSKFHKRELSLDGEAFFDVVPNKAKPFNISTGEVTISVLGTSFNLRAYTAERVVEVAVQKGRVAVRSAHDQKREALLEAGTAVVFDKDKQELSIIEDSQPNVEAWKSRQLIFNDTDMKAVLSVLERYFGVEMDVSNPSILDCHLSASFDDPDIQSVIDVLAATFGLEVLSTGNQFMFKGKGCQPLN